MLRDDIRPSEAEQEIRYEALARVSSESLAFFYCCISFDMPFELEAIPRDNPMLPWLAYLDNLRIKKLDVGENGKAYGFLDGLTDITKIFGNLKKGEFSKAVDAEVAARNNKEPGTKKQRKDWGSGDAGKRYTTEDYNRLDELFETFSARLVSAGGYDAQQEFILRLCCRMTLDMEKLLAAGQIDKAQKLNRMIQDNLASENLRKKDAKPVEDFRLDSWADALEKAGLTKNGKRCSPDEMFEILFGRPTRYPYTKDAAEQIIFINENRARVNDGMSELSTIEDDMRLHDDLGEFATEQIDMEKVAYDRLGLVKFPPPCKRLNDWD